VSEGREQRHWEDLAEGDEVPAVEFPLSVFRMVVAAGAVRDFHPSHYSTEVAQSFGAPDAFANTTLLQAMWERTVRDFIGAKGTIRRVAGFAMRGFSAAGDTVIVGGRVARTWLEDEVGFAELELWSDNSRAGRVVGPGTVTVTLPRRDAPRPTDGGLWPTP
jgi:hypothetical protein